MAEHDVIIVGAGILGLSTAYHTKKTHPDTDILVIDKLSAAGAAYSARWTTAHFKELKESIKKAIQTPGFRFIEVVTQCPTAYGRRVGFKDVGEMLRYFKENAVLVEQAERMSPEELERKIVVGEFVSKRRPTLVEAVYAVIKEAKESGKQN
jgi:2-oxoglutarate ferredoxin oxidoreductase subunit beta